MDYEKAYKAVLKTATQWINDGCTDKEKICLECVFPELRESEDKRIRKAIVHLFEVASEAYLIEATGFKKEQFLSYLEKQKERKKDNPLEDFSKGYNAGYYHGCTDNEQKLVEWNEKDGRTLKGIIGKIDHDQTYGVSKAEMLSFLNRFRPSWKPSEEQMDALKELIDDANKAGWVTPGATELYEQLKKL